MPQPYDPLIHGERRQNPSPAPSRGHHDADLSDIWDLLRALDKKVELHLQDEAEFRPKMVELVSILEKSKGAVTLIKILVGVVAPVWALFIWAKDHVKL